MEREVRLKLICEMNEKRMSDAKIGRLLGISHQRVHQIRTGYQSPYNRYIPKPPLEHKIVTPAFRVAAGLPPRRNDEQKWVQRFRERVRVRDNHTCQICFKKWRHGQRRLDVHHLDENHEGKSESENAQYDRENMDRMITLCHKCHFNLDSVRNKIGRKPKVARAA